MNRGAIRALGLMFLLGGASPVAAQVIPVRPPGQQGTPRTPPLPEDSAKRVVPVTLWAPLDSVALELLKRTGMTAIRYQGNTVEYRAATGEMLLIGAKGARAIVEREPTSLTADTITFSERSDSILARGDTIVMRDPSKGDDLVAHGRLAYDVANRRGSATNVSSSAKTGEIWFVSAHRAAFSAADSVSGRPDASYFKDGIITSCTETTPHFHFAAGEIKRISNDMVVARNVVMHVMGVPVFWLPFIFQDSRSGRRSGILTPRFGFTELVRNSPFYRRTVENIGYYFALSDYYDFAASLDWRSSANATNIDPGWTRWNSEMRYRWLNRFASGRIGASVHSLSSGLSNTQVSWSHSQDFSITSHLTVDLNFATSTTVQKQTAIAPTAALATIASRLNYQRSLGPAQLSIGGSRRQYPGRAQVDMDFPSVNITSKPLNLGEWLTWTPGLQASSSESRHIDAQGDFATRFIQRSDGTLDSAKVDRGTHAKSLTVNTPFKIFDFQVQASVRASDRGNDYPELRTVIDPTDTSRKSTRVFERTWLSERDFDLGVNLPQFFGGTLNLSPSITMSNVGPGALMVRTERTGSRWVTQGKRLSYGAGISPTFFAFYRGLGPIDRFRHSVQTGLSYSFSPEASIDPEYLAALGQTSQGFLGTLAQNRVTLSIRQVFEAKLKSANPDSASPEAGKKIKLLSLQFSPVTWDFERAAKTGKSGFATENFDIGMSSDLLPGFDAGVGYSLFQGSVLADSAVFSPFLTSVRASFSLGAGSGVGGIFGRLFGGPNTEAVVDTTALSSANAGIRGGQGGMGTGQAGQSIRGAGIDVPSGKGFEAQISFSLSQQRPPVGGRVVEYDPTLQCALYKDVNPLQYDFCVRNALATPPADVNATQTTAGGTFFRVPPQMNIQFRTGFNLTPNWSASWSTNYDFQRSEFGMQTVSLAREMHDWRALFGFTQAPNGNFSFTFNVALKSEPDIKFDYNRQTYGGQGSTIPR